MRSLFLPLLFILTFCTCVRAQNHDDKLAYVEGPVYKVINAATGPVVLWKGEPAAADQIRTDANGNLEVYPPDSDEPRLLITLQKDGTLEAVTDLAYQTDSRKPLAEPKEKYTDGPVRVNFANGLCFSYSDGEASASFAGHPVPVTGSKGRYRIETEDYEAGIAFGPMWGNKVYQYLKEK